MFSKNVMWLQNFSKKNFEECNLSLIEAVQVNCVSKLHETEEYGENILDVLEDRRRPRK